MDGVLNVNKPAGPTSHDIVLRVRRLLAEKRVGHTGTLDPLATGVLVVCIGKATRIVEYLVSQDKEYAAEMVLGRTTTTEDLAGEETSATNASHITRAMVEEVLPRFTGRILQVPPMVSAIKHKGRRLYELARKDIEVERQPREVTIHRLEVTGLNSDRLSQLSTFNFQLSTPNSQPSTLNPQPSTLSIGLLVVCSSGTYIRTLCADIGAALGVGGCMRSLIRRRVGPFDLEHSVELEALEQAAAEGRAEALIVPMDEALSGFPAVTADPVQAGTLARGGGIPATLSAPEGTLVRVRSGGGELLAIGRVHPRGRASVIMPEKVFVESKP